MVNHTRESEREQLSIATNAKTKVNWEFIGGSESYVSRNESAGHGGASTGCL